MTTTTLDLATHQLRIEEQIIAIGANGHGIETICAWLIDQLAHSRIETDQLKADARADRNVMVESGAILEWVEAALNGEKLSEFAESFPIVYRVVELVEQAIDAQRGAAF